MTYGQQTCGQQTADHKTNSEKTCDEIERDDKSISMKVWKKRSLGRPAVGRILVACATSLGVICHGFAQNTQRVTKKPITFDYRPKLVEIRDGIARFLESILTFMLKESESAEDEPLSIAYVAKICRKWEKVFGAKADEVLSIIKIESGFCPNRKYLLRSEKGGAWGLGGQMLDEVAGKISLIAKMYGNHPYVAKTIARWDGTTKSLLDPELNVMLTSWQVSHIRKRLADIDEDSFEAVAASYHQGTNAVVHRLESLEEPTSKKTPRGHSYVKRAIAALEFFQKTSKIPIVNY